MTIPTASVSASIVIEFSVKSAYQIRPNVAMMDVGIAIAAMSVERQFQRNTSTTSAARIEPTMRCSSTVLIDARMNSDRSRTTITLYPGGVIALMSASRSFTASTIATVFTPDWRRMVRSTGRLAAHVRQRRGVRHAVVDGRDVAEEYGMSVAHLDDDVAEFDDRLHASARAKRHLRRAGLDSAAGDLGVLRIQRARDVGHRQVVGLKLRRIERDVDLTLASADDQHLADAGDAFELPPERLVGVLRDVADRLVGRHGQRHDGRRIRVELVDDRLLDVLREEREHPVDAVAHFLRRDVAVLLEQESDDHRRDAFRRGGAELVDAADRVDRFFDLVRDLGLDFLRRRTGQARRDDDRGEVDLRKAIEAKPREREGADDRQREDQDAREDGALDGNCC